MGVRFRKSIKIAPGVKINVGKKSVGLSVGGKGAGMTFNSRTGTRARVSVPGTGLSYSTKIGGKKKTNKSQSSSSSSSSTSGSFFKKYWRLILGIFFLISAVSGLGGELEVGAVILGFVISTGFLLWHFLASKSKKADAAKSDRNNYNNEIQRVPASEYIHESSASESSEGENDITDF